MMRAGLILSALALFLSCKTTGGRKTANPSSEPSRPGNSSDGKTISTDPAHLPLDPNNQPQPVANGETIQIQILFQQKEAVQAKSPQTVEFVVAAGTGSGAWNTQSNPFYAEQGQSLKFINSDTIVHRLHTDGKPCEHGVDFAPGASTSCALNTLYDPAVDQPLYDHNFDVNARFWLKVLPPLKKTLEDRCLGCHSGAKPEGGLDLLSWPPRSGSAALATAFNQRLAKTAPANKKMPVGAELSEPEREVLLRWAALNFPRPAEGIAASPNQRSIRWSLLWNNKKMQEGVVNAPGVSIPYPKDATRVIVRLEEFLRGSWMVLQEQEVFTSMDATVLIPVRSPVTSFPAEANIDSIFQFVQDGQIRKVEDFLLALPEAFKRNYVLMRDTKSRHLSDVTHPRLINFSDSGRLLLGFSSHPDDPLRENVELAEAMPDGSWKFREINFLGNSVQLSADDTACKVCHTAQPRPIWGSYPNWPGAFGDEGGKVTAEEFAALSQLATLPTSKDRFAALSFSLRPEGPSFYLPKRSYSYPNTVMNVTLGRRAAYQHYKRMQKASDYAAVMLYTIGEQECPDWTYSSALHQRWRDLLTAPDMALHRSAKESIVENDRYWNQSSANLDDFISFFGLLDLIHKDTRLSAIFQPVLGMMESYAQTETMLDGVLVDFRPHQYVYRRVLGSDGGQPEETPLGPGLSARRTEFCALLKSY